MAGLRRERIFMRLVVAFMCLMSSCIVGHRSKILSYDTKKQIFLMCIRTDGAARSVACLLDDGIVSVNIRDDRGNTLLHKAAAYGNYALAKVLLERGAAVNARNSNGATPLHALVESGFATPHFIRMLLHQGADYAAGDLSWNTPLHYAARSYRHLAAKMLYEELILHEVVKRYTESRTKIMYVLYHCKRQGLSKDIAHFILLKGPELRQALAIVLANHLIKGGWQALKPLENTILYRQGNAKIIARNLMACCGGTLVAFAKKVNFHAQEAFDVADVRQRSTFTPERLRGSRSLIRSLARQLEKLAKDASTALPSSLSSY